MKRQFRRLPTTDDQQPWMLMLAILLAGLLGAFVIVPVVSLPYLGDDYFNRGWGQLSIDQSIAQSSAMLRGWMTEEGRFFPSALAYHVLIWHLFTDRSSYHVYLAILNAAIVGTVSLLALGISRRITFAVTAGAFCASSMQFRYWTVDGITNMGGQVTIALLLTIASTILCSRFLKGGSIFFGLASMVTWSIAITTYEVSALMFPAMLVGLFFYCPHWSFRSFLSRTLPLTIPFALDLLMVGYLRHNAHSPSVAYSINLHGPVADTAFRQALAAIPSSQYFFHGVPPNLSPPHTGALFLFFILALPATYLLFRSTRDSFRRTDRRSSLPLLLIGLWIWGAPAVLVGINSRWQNDLPQGQGYIYTIFSSVGLSFVIVAMLIAVASVSRKKLRVGGVVLLTTGCLLLACYTAASNARYSSDFTPGPTGPAGP
jgi:hypothetical protein